MTCPADRHNLDEDRDVFPDKATERKILSLVIKCPSDGCGWTGELRNKEVHLESCSFMLLVCVNFSCGAKVQRRHLEQHQLSECPWRIFNCEYCSEPHPECQMQDHIKECSRFPVTCPNSCGRSIPREMVSTHTEDECPLTVISCPYARMGCKTKIQRQAVESHLESSTRVHLDLVSVKLHETEVKLGDTEIKLDNTETILYKTKSELKDAMESLHTTTFIWKIDGYSEVLRQAKTEGKKALHSDPFYTKTEKDSNGYKVKVVIYPNGGGPGKGTHLSVFIKVIKGAYDAILPWPIKKKVKFELVDQHEDLAQRENVIGEIRDIITKQSLSRPTGEENPGRGFGKFVSHTKLNTRQYIVDDTLFLRVTISPSINSLFGKMA